MSLSFSRQQQEFAIWDSPRAIARLQRLWGDVQIKEETSGEWGSWSGKAHIISGDGVVRYVRDHINKARSYRYFVAEGGVTSEISERAYQKLYIVRLIGHLKALSSNLPRAVSGSETWQDPWRGETVFLWLDEGFLHADESRVLLLRYALESSAAEKMYEVLQSIKAEVGEVRCAGSELSEVRHSMSYERRLNYLTPEEQAIVREAYNAYLLGDPHPWMP